MIALFIANLFHSFLAFSSASESFFSLSISHPVISLGALISCLILDRLKIINSWSDGVGFSSSISQVVNCPSSVVVKVKSMIDLSLPLFLLVLTPGVLFRIRLYRSIISSKYFDFWDEVFIKGFQ
jgi:hypothetical protein